MKGLVFLLALLPFLKLVYDAANAGLGANPVEEMTERTGRWALWFLLFTLALTPVRLLTGLCVVNQWRRMLGLYTFFYATLHLLIFLFFEHRLTWAYITEDIVKSPTVDVGLIAYFMLAPLALTSTDAMTRRLGRQWKKLHNTVHIAALVVMLHYFLTVKADISLPLSYCALLLLLQGVRGVARNRKKGRAPVTRRSLPKQPCCSTPAAGGRSDLRRRTPDNL